MSLARRAREAYENRFDESGIEESLAYTAAEEIAVARERLDEEIARNPLESADKTVGAQGIIKGGGGHFIEAEDLEMHGLEGSHLNEEAEYYVFEDGSILQQDENGNFHAHRFNRDLEQEQTNELSIDEQGYDPERDGFAMDM